MNCFRTAKEIFCGLVSLSSQSVKNRITNLEFNLIILMCVRFKIQKHNLLCCSFKVLEVGPLKHEDQVKAVNELLDYETRKVCSQIS